MESVLTLLLIRFGIIVGVVVLLALVVFAGALMLRRQGKLDQVRKRAAPELRQAVERYLASRERHGDRRW